VDYLMICLCGGCLGKIIYCKDVLILTFLNNTPNVKISGSEVQ
jgi:hypothetical protein